MANKRLDLDSLETANAAVLAQIVVEPFTPDTLRVQILNKLLEGAESENFFDSIFAESLSLGDCPECGHTNHWLVPEDDLNRKGWVTSEKDDRVPRTTDRESCPEWQESCKKKRITI